MPTARNLSLPALLEELLGYLNFSSGAEDAAFLSNLCALYRHIEAGGKELETSLATARGLLLARLDVLEKTSAAFADAAQARSVVTVAFDELPAAYRRHHRDLLLHQSDAALWRPLLLGRMCEAVLRQGGPWDDQPRLVAAALEEINDYIGYRPVAVLRTAQRIEPYEHEWVRPIPLYVRGAAVAPGRYEALLSAALDLLRRSSADLLAEASFDPQLLDELALDPRAYDFEHPVNKRPNYHFGQWDPHHLDRQGRFRRFVLQQVPLDGLLDRLSHVEGDRQELLLEAAAVLAGTILMASGTTGSAPQTHDSTISLATLLPKIAGYRDAFYEQLLVRMPAAHGRRLREEAQLGRQPFAGARQALNQYMARRRASQIEQVHLALVFAEMGYAEAATQKAQAVSVASARMRCEIQCRLTAGALALEAGDVALAASQLPQIEEFLKRAIEIGAVVDPWNILGFQGQFSLFPALENSVTDHRIEQLIALVDQLFNLYLRVTAEAAARNLQQLETKVSASMKRLAQWWDQFAATTVECVEAFSGEETYRSSRKVAEALSAWHVGGTAAGDIAFWREHVEEFQEAKSYALVVEVLLGKGDYLASMALLMHWLGQAGSVRLQEGDYSFHDLARRWLESLCAAAAERSDVKLAGRPPAELAARFFDLLEANAEDFWQVPTLDAGRSRSRPRRAAADERQEADDRHEGDDDRPADEVVAAAYEDFVYVDSTDDGNEGETLEAGGPASDFALEVELRSLRDHLSFLTTVAQLWKRAALARSAGAHGAIGHDLAEGWHQDARQKSQALLALLDDANAYRIPAPTASRESLLEFDRRRSVKDTLLESVMNAAAAMGDAEAYLELAGRPNGDLHERSGECALLTSVLERDPDRARAAWPDFLDAIKGRTLLYVSPSRGGNPRQVVAARQLQRTMRDLLTWMPRVGLLRETVELLRTARLMESEHPVGPGAISEFDQLFTIGNQALVEALEAASRNWSPAAADDEKDAELVECLEQLTQSLLVEWLAHSRTLRLSVLERVADAAAWKGLVSFIETYGGDLFTQRFLNQGNLRAILHQGVDVWLEKLEADPEAEGEHRLVADLEQGKVDRKEAVRQLALVIEAVVENYGEYRDYNSTTTQSDQGELLYMLLDFVRLRLQYDRIAWHLRPVVAAHEILVRRGRSAAAELWRRALAERTREVADSLVVQYERLRAQYGMRLPTVGDRLHERFVRELAIDNVKSLVEPAMTARDARSQDAFSSFQSEVEELAAQPTGIGLEVPKWILALEEEVRRAHARLQGRIRAAEALAWLPHAELTFDAVQAELAAISRGD